MVNLIYSMPNWVFGVVITALVVAYSVGGLLLVHRVVPATRRRSHNDVAAAVSSLVGVVFAVLMAFVAIAVWQQFDQAESTVMHEAAAAGDVWRQALGYPEPLKATVRDGMKKYVDAVIKEEWPLQIAGKMDLRKDARQVLESTHAAMLLFEPKTIGQQIVHAEQLKDMNTLLDQRRIRLHAADVGISGMLWVVILVGCALTIALIWFFGTESLGAHIAMTLVLALSIALVLFLIASMDYPFRGETSVSADAFELVLKSMERMAVEEKAGLVR